MGPFSVKPVILPVSFAKGGETETRPIKNKKIGNSNELFNLLVFDSLHGERLASYFGLRWFSVQTNIVLSESHAGDEQNAKTVIQQELIRWLIKELYK